MTDAPDTLDGELPASRLAFYVSSEAWYWKSLPKKDRIVHEVMVTRRPINEDGTEAGGCIWEFAVEWHDFNDGRVTACRLGVFDDAFAALVEIPEFFTAMAHLHNPSLDRVKQLLVDLGFTVHRRDRAD